jgi:hypothetical protein
MVCLLFVHVLEAIAIVWEPQVGDASIEAYWEQTGNNHIQISYIQTLKVNIIQQSNVKASFAVIACCDNGGIAIYPEAQGTGGIEPQETATLTFGISNLGVEKQIDNIPITITIYDTFIGEELTKETVYATLLATLRPGQTDLKILAVEENTNNPAIGVEITVFYPANGQGEQKQVWTDTSGEAILNLQMHHGGAYIGDIYIQTTENNDYFAENLTSAVHLDSNEATLELEPKNPQEPTNSGIHWAIPPVIFAAAVIIIIIIVILWKKK